MSANDEELVAMLADERRRIAELATRLTPEQWRSPSLCSNWRVGDVVAHLVVTAESRAVQHVARALRHRFRLDVMIDVTARNVGREPPLVLAARLERAARSHRHPPGRRTQHVLADTVVHGFDIREPLGISYDPPAERLRLTLDAVLGLDSMPVCRPRVAGLHLVAEDLNWQAGDGPEVRGPADALLLAMTGRRVGLSRLAGSGLDTIASRIDHAPT